MGMTGLGVSEELKEQSDDSSQWTPHILIEDAQDEHYDLCQGHHCNRSLFPFPQLPCVLCEPCAQYAQCAPYVLYALCVHLHRSLAHLVRHSVPHGQAAAMCAAYVAFHTLLVSVTPWPLHHHYLRFPEFEAPGVREALLEKGSHSPRHPKPQQEALSFQCSHKAGDHSSSPSTPCLVLHHSHSLPQTLRWSHPSWEEAGAHDAASASSDDDDPLCGALVATHPISMVASHGDDASHVGNVGNGMH